MTQPTFSVNENHPLCFEAIIPGFIPDPNIFLQSSRISCLLLYKSKTTEMREQYDAMAEKKLDGLSLYYVLE